jgi:hypothetical protein
MKVFLTSMLIFATVLANAQTNSLRLNPNIVLPQDSIESKNLTTSLNDFLLSAQQPNEENRFVFEPEKIETFIQLDEINGIGKNKKFNDDFFYKPYLTNVVLLKDKNYLIQVSYIGVHENTPLLRASFEFIAHKSGGFFKFSSPLISNTKYWKMEKFGNEIFHYKQTLNKKSVEKFVKLVKLYDTKLKVVNKVTDYYCTENLMEMQKIIGVEYKSDYNGETESVWSSSLGDRKLIVFGNDNATFNTLDPHDLFHDRLSLIIPRSNVNKPVDEGCAYLYGGSWGLTWEEIFKAFKTQIANNKNVNWVEIKENPVSFVTNGYPNSADDIVNALLVKKIEKEHGFAAVWELLNVGAFEKGNEKYYRTLEKLTGITKATYNETIGKLINNEK